MATQQHWGLQIYGDLNVWAAQARRAPCKFGYSSASKRSSLYTGGLTKPGSTLNMRCRMLLPHRALPAACCRPQGIAIPQQNFTN